MYVALLCTPQEGYENKDPLKSVGARFANEPHRLENHSLIASRGLYFLDNFFSENVSFPSIQNNKCALK